MNIESPLGVAVVGLGIGEQHARAFAALPECRVICLFDLDFERAVRLSPEIPGSCVVHDFDSLLAREDIGIISIASFDDAHFEQVTKALAAGKHVFVEKPLCRTLRELSEIKRLWAGSRKRLWLGSNLVLRAAPLYQWLRQQVTDKHLGELYAIDGDYLYGRLHKITDGWRRDVKDYSVNQGGAIHMIDLMLWITGQRPDSVTAAGNQICSSGSDFQYNDFCSSTLTFPSGMVGRITANYGCVHRHHHVMRIFGTEGTFLYDDAGARLHTSRDPKSTPSPLDASPLPAGKGELIPGFVASILSGSDFSFETQSIFDGISVAIACDRAAASGLSEKVEYV